MQKLFALLTLLLILHACNNLSSNAANKNNAADIPQTTGPDASDLLMTLQGRWQSQQDSTYILEFADTKMRHLNHGKLSLETDIEIDGSCLASPCRMDSTDLTDGWCFMEKGKNDVQCFIIIDCDKEYLKFNAIGAENAVQVFKKL